MSRKQAQDVLGERLVLPTLPEIVLRLNALIADRTVGLQQIGELVAQDASITAKVLCIANSAYYGLKEPVLSAEQAATVVGAISLRNIALQASVIQRYEHLEGLQGFDLEGLWRHSILTGQLAQRVAKQATLPLDLEPEEFYTCGLLHDLGKVVMLDTLKQDYVELLRGARDAREALHNRELAQFGFTHVDVGALVAQRWQLPEEHARAIEFHHGPGFEVLGSRTVTVVALADQIAYRLESPSLELVLPRLKKLAEDCLGAEGGALDQVVTYGNEIAGLIEI